MTSKQVSTVLEVLSAVIISFTIAIYLAYVDEGARNFEWTKNPNNWFFVGIVFSFFLFSQYLARILFLREHEGLAKVILSFVLGMVLLASAIFELIFVGKAFALLSI